MSSGVGSVGNGPSHLANPLSSNPLSKLNLSSDITKRNMPITCVASLTTPGRHRRPKADQLKTINPPDPNDRDYDRSNVKMRIDNKRVLRPNLFNDSDEDDDVSDSDGSGESDLTEDREGDLSEGDTGSKLVESPRSGEEKCSESDDEGEDSEAISHSDDEKSDSLSGSDADEDGGSRRRSRSLRRDCASDDDVDDIWEIPKDVLEKTSAVLNISNDVLKISDCGETHKIDDNRIQEKMKSEKEDLLIFGRIRKPKPVITTPTKGNQQFPRGTKKFNPCHIDRNFHRNMANTRARAGPQSKSYSASHRSGKNTRTNRQDQSNRKPSGKVDGYGKGEKLWDVPKKETLTRTDLSCDQKPASLTVSPQPTVTLPFSHEHSYSNQNNNKPVTYADVCRRNPPKTSPSKPAILLPTTENHAQKSTALPPVSSTPFKKSYSDSEIEPKVTKAPQMLSSSSSSSKVELSNAKDEEPSDAAVVEGDSESAKSPVPFEIKSQDPAIVSVSTFPPRCPSLLEQSPPECSSPGPVPSYPIQGVPLFPPQYMTYANSYAYSNYLFSVLNHMSPQDMLMIFYELKMLEALNATLIQPPAPNTL